MNRTPTTLGPELKARIVARLRAEFEPESIRVFGSRAWGEASDDSDIDHLRRARESPAARAHRFLRGLFA